MATRYEKLEEVYQHAFVSNKVRSSHDKSPTRIMLDVSGQHTLRWAAVEMRLLDGALQPVHSKDCNMSLPAGECNLYTFPLVRMDGADALLDGDELHALTELILALATDPATAEMMLTPDCVGAYPIHALLVANTEASLALAMRLFRAEPSLMLQPHTQALTLTRTRTRTRTLTLALALTRCTTCTAAAAARAAASCCPLGLGFRVTYPDPNPNPNPVP